MKSKNTATPENPKTAKARRAYYKNKSIAEGKQPHYTRPYADQVELLPQCEEVYVVWVSEVYGSNYGYNRAVYPSLSGAILGARGIKRSKEYAQIADRIVVYKQEFEDASFAGRYVPNRKEFVCIP